MKENQATQRKRTYIAPAVRIFRMEISAQIMETSFPGQHNPGHHGNGPDATPAKGGFFDEEDGFEKTGQEDL